MAYEKKPNTGTLGRNKRKESDSHPDFSGSLNVEGKDYWLSGWIKENKSTGEKFFSLSAKAKEAIRADERPRPVAVSDEPDDEIPF